VRYRFAIWLLRPLLIAERWRCIGALEATDATDRKGLRSSGYFQGRIGVLDDLIARKSIPWMGRGPVTFGDDDA